MMSASLIALFAVGPALLLLGQGPLRRYRLAVIEREFQAHWAALTPAQKAHALAAAGKPVAADPDAAARSLFRGAWAQMRAAGAVDFHRLRAYGEVLLRTARTPAQ